MGVGKEARIIQSEASMDCQLQVLSLGGAHHWLLSTDPWFLMMVTDCKISVT